MSEHEHQPGGHWREGVARDNARVQNGHPFIQNQHINNASKAESQPFDLVKALEFDHMTSHVASIDPAIQKTCQWIFDTQEYRSWRDPGNFSSHHDFQWIKGKAGCGKSTAMKCALEFAERYYHNDAVISFFFHAHGYPLEKTVEGMYRSLLSQLLRRFPDCRSALPDHAPWNIRQESWRIDLLRNYLSKVVLKLPRGSTVTMLV